LAQYLADPSSSRPAPDGWLPGSAVEAGDALEVHPTGVALLSRDPDFADGIPGQERRMAERRVVLPRLDLAVGEWSGSSPIGGRPPVTGAVVMAGLLARDALLGGRTATQLLGPGDIFDPWTPSDGVLPCGVRWRVHEPVTLAILDRRFAVAALRWPSLSVRVQSRLNARANQLSALAAIGQLSRVDDRVLALLWHLAERFGRVTGAGVLVPLRLTHAFIGQLVGARRSTVTLAIQRLENAGLVTRRVEGWLLEREGRAALDPDAEGPAHAI
jgi:hypothetical protein